MSDVGKLRRSGGSSLPTVRKSPDPMQPEMGEMDFSQDLVEHEAQMASSISETEKAEQAAIREENRRKQYRRRKKREKDEEEEDQETPKEQDSFVDVTA